MKTRLSVLTLLIVSAVLLLTSCGKDGRDGKDGINGTNGLDAEVYYSPWFHPTWVGQTNDWYFDVADPAISQDIVEAGVILAYVSLPGDLYPAAVRQLPAYALGCNWDYLIPDYGQIEFMSDASAVPGSSDYYFRYILIPGNIPLKSTAGIKYNADELKKMSYLEVCKKFGIPE
jgi:hypothetical protein